MRENAAKTKKPPSYWLTIGVRVHRDGRHSPILRNQVDTELSVERMPSPKRMQAAALEAKMSLARADLYPKGKPKELDLLWEVKRMAHKLLDRAALGHNDWQQELQSLLDRVDDEYIDPEER